MTAAKNVKKTTMKDVKRRRGGAARQGAKWGLALGGGGARGITHVGILKALERTGLVPDVIAGTSVGALMGGAYACRPEAAALERRLAEVLAPENGDSKPLRLAARLNWDDSAEVSMLDRLMQSLRKEIFVGLALFRNGVMSTDDLRRGVAAFLPDIDLAETKIPFIATAVDMLTGGTAWLRRGSAIDAVMASCAMPGYMPPVSAGNALLMDGGIAALIPSAAARSGGADIVVGVDVGIEHIDACRIANGIDAIDRAIDIMSYHLGDAGRSDCDLVIEPLDGHVAWTDFDSYRELIRQGEAAVEGLRDTLDRLLTETAAA